MSSLYVGGFIYLIHWFIYSFIVDDRTGQMGKLSSNTHIDTGDQSREDTQKKTQTKKTNKTLKCIFLFKKWGKKHLQWK